MFEQLVEAGLCRGNDRLRQGHRLEARIREVVDARGKHDEATACYQRPELLVTNGGKHANTWKEFLQVRLNDVGECPAIPSGRDLPGEDEGHVGAGLQHSRQNVNDSVCALQQADRAEEHRVGRLRQVGLRLTACRDRYCPCGVIRGRDDFDLDSSCRFDLLSQKGAGAVYRAAASQLVPFRGV